MKHYFYIISFLIFSVSTASFAQSGEIKGKVINKQIKSPLPFANIMIELNGNAVAGAQTDLEGKYSIKPLAPGKYNVKAVLDGYKTSLVKGVLVASDKSSDVTLEMQSDSLKRAGVSGKP